MPDGFNETPVRGKHLHNSAGPAETAVATLAAVASGVDPSFTEGNLVHLSTDLAGNLRVVLGREAEDGALDVDVVDRQERILGLIRTDADTRADDTARTNALRDALLAGLESVSLNADTRDDLVTRLSTNLESVDLNDATRTFITEHTQKLRVRGAEVSDTNPIPVNVQTNPGTLVDSGLLTSPNVAPGASVTLDSTAIPAGVRGHLVELTASSSVRIKVVLRNMGTGAGDRRVFFVDPTSSSLIYLPVDRDAITAAAGGAFRVTITNMDNLRTADVYASITHVEV